MQNYGVLKYVCTVHEDSEEMFFPCLLAEYPREASCSNKKAIPSNLSLLLACWVLLDSEFCLKLMSFGITLDHLFMAVSSNLLFIRIYFN